jgi:hypothetical protein
LVINQLEHGNRFLTTTKRTSSISSRNHDEKTMKCATTPQAGMGADLSMKGTTTNFITHAPIEIGIAIMFMLVHRFCSLSQINVM